jgi:amino acid transporter
LNEDLIIQLIIIGTFIPVLIIAFYSVIKRFIKLGKNRDERQFLPLKRGILPIGSVITGLLTLILFPIIFIQIGDSPLRFWALIFYLIIAGGTISIFQGISKMFILPDDVI